MKKSLRLMAVCVLATLAFAGCASSVPSSASASGSKAVLSVADWEQGGKIAFIDTEDGMESLFGQSVWSAISRFAGEEGVDFNYYVTQASSSLATQATLELAVAGGSTFVVAHGNAMQVALLPSLEEYPNVQFIFLDVEPLEDVPKNAIMVGFIAEQAGWLAGYAAVREGFTNLAFFEAKQGENLRYGLGFALGAEAAAEDAGLAERSIYIYQIPLADRPQGDDLVADLVALYKNGTHLVFGNDPALKRQLIEGALLGNGLLMGIGINLETEGDMVLAATQKNPREVLLTFLALLDADKQPISEAVYCGVSQQGVLLYMEADRFQNFSDWQYQSAQRKLLNEEYAAQISELVSLGEDGAIPSLGELPLRFVVSGVRPVAPVYTVASSSVISSQSAVSEAVGLS